MPNLLDGYGWMVLTGLKLTVVVALASMAGAVIIGFIAALGSIARSRALRSLIGVYTTVIRGIPELVLLLLVYYGVPTLIQDLATAVGLDIVIGLSPFAAGVGTLAFIYGAFATQVFRAAYLNVPRGQAEAAVAFGLGPFDTWRYIMFPQMMRYALPGLGNVWMVLLKATALISVIQLPELMRASDVAARATHKPFTFFLIACCAYLVITLLSMWGQAKAERWAGRGVVRGGP